MLAEAKFASPEFNLGTEEDSLAAYCVMSRSSLTIDDELLLKSALFKFGLILFPGPARPPNLNIGACSGTDV